MVLPSFEEELTMNLGETNLEGLGAAGPSVVDAMEAELGGNIRSDFVAPSHSNSDREREFDLVDTNGDGNITREEYATAKPVKSWFDFWNPLPPAGVEIVRADGGCKLNPQADYAQDWEYNPVLTNRIIQCGRYWRDEGYSKVIDLVASTMTPSVCCRIVRPSLHGAVTATIISLKHTQIRKGTSVCMGMAAKTGARWCPTSRTSPWTTLIRLTGRCLWAHCASCNIRTLQSTT